MKGRLELIVGCTSSGKSEELIRRLRRAVIAHQKVIVFKPKKDTRTEETIIASRDGKRHDAFSIVSPVDIIERIGHEHHVVGIEEAQFFDQTIVTTIMKLVDEFGLRVIVAGLDTDFRGEPYGYIPQLMAIADTVDKMTAICMQCRGVAVRSQRLISGGPRDQVGGDEMYEARCRDCHSFPH